MTINVLAVVVVAVACVVVSSVWYAALGRPLARLHPAYATVERPSPWTALLELVRSLAVVTVFAVLCFWADVGGAAGGARLGLLLWIGFPVVILSGSVLHERVPARLAGIHAGDWLLKLVLMGLIVGAWR